MNSVAKGLSCVVAFFTATVLAVILGATAGIVFGFLVKFIYSIF